MNNTHQPTCYFCTQPLLMGSEVSSMYSGFYKGHTGVCLRHNHRVFHNYYKYNLCDIDFVLNKELQLKGNIDIPQNKLVLFTYYPLEDPILYQQDITLPISYEYCQQLLEKVIKMKAFL